MRSEGTNERIEPHMEGQGCKAAKAETKATKMAVQGRKLLQQTIHLVMAAVSVYPTCQFGVRAVGTQDEAALTKRQGEHGDHLTI